MAKFLLTYNGIDYYEGDEVWMYNPACSELAHPTSWDAATDCFKVTLTGLYMGRVDAVTISYYKANGEYKTGSQYSNRLRGHVSKGKDYISNRLVQMYEAANG